MYLTKYPLLTCSHYFQHGSSSKCNMNIVFYLPLVLYLAAPKKVALDTPVPAGVIIPRKTLGYPSAITILSTNRTKRSKALFCFYFKHY